MVRARIGRTETGAPARRAALASHFEQRIHVRHRLDRHGARAWLDYADADPETLARAIADGIASTPRYRSVSGAGVGRAAALIAELLSSESTRIPTRGRSNWRASTPHRRI